MHITIFALHFSSCTMKGLQAFGKVAVTKQAVIKA